MKNRLTRLLLFLLFTGLFIELPGQVPATRNTQKPPARVVAGIPVNYSEDSVGVYTLPDPLVLLNGQKVTDAKTWYDKRRPEIVKLYEENQFGRCPDRPKDMSFNVFEKGSAAFDGKAIRRQVTVYFTRDTSAYKMDLLIYIPANAKGKVPVLLNVGFSPNSSTVADSMIKQGYTRGRDGKLVAANRSMQFGRLNILPFIEQGIGVATVYYGDIEPDFGTGIKYGIRGHYLKPGSTKPEPDEWGAIAAWAWGLSRAMDYFITDKNIDAGRVALFGVSRLGKTVLWTAANDTRFAMVIASCSGEGGAALSRRNYGETIKHLADSTRYFYQFCANYGKYGDRVNEFPVDAHMLLSLIAPRAVLLQTGDTDNWSDPKGEFLAAVAAEPVFKLLGSQGLETSVMPPAGVPILNKLGYYMHSGGHGALPSDYPVFLTYMKKYFLPGK
jgi:hypothetical protein